MQVPRGEIRSLTGLRGIAACFVVALHYFQEQQQQNIFYTIVNHGFIAVDLFFVLSGFVMALTYARSFQSGFSWPTYADFLGKRLARVYPLFFVATVACLALMACGVWRAEFPDIRAVLSNLLMIQTWGIADSIDGTTWSISTELAAYLIFPALVTAFLMGGRLRWLGAACCAAGLLVLVATRSSEQIHQVNDGIAWRGGPLDVFDERTAFPILRCVAGFSLGMVAFRGYSWIRARGVGVPGWAANVTAGAILVLLAIRGSDVFLVLTFAGFVLLLATSRSLTASALASAPVYWLGEASYSIYLLHRPIEDTLRDRFNAALQHIDVPHAFTLSAASCVVLTIPLAAVTLYGIEKPARNGIRRLMHERPRALQTDPGAP